MTMQGMKVEVIDKYPGLGEKQTKELSAAIIRQSIADYMIAVRDNKKRTKRDCEEFFVSDWFEALSSVYMDGHKIIDRLQSGVRSFVTKSVDKFDAGWVSHHKKSGEVDPADIAFRCPLCGGETYIHFQCLRTLKKTKTNIYGFKAHCVNCGFANTREVLHRKVVKKDER